MNFNLALPPGPLRQTLAAAAYALVVGGLAFLAVDLAATLYDQTQVAHAARDDLARLNARFVALTASSGQNTATDAVSPLIEGDTITQAAAALQHRIGQAAAEAGGALMSTEPQWDAPNAAPGFISLSAEVELPEPALQAFLYDLEAGLPFIFIDKFGLELATAASDGKPAPLRLTLVASGKWGAQQR